MNPLVITLSAQLLYYLLIAQTGVVGAMHSDISELYTLPLGGMAGAAASAFVNHTHLRKELIFLFGVQGALAFFYPDYSLVLLALMGFVIGYSVPLLLFVFGTQGKWTLAIGFALSYTIGTALYGYPFDQRGWIAALLPLLSLGALVLSPPVSGEVLFVRKRVDWEAVGIMMLWIFADSALFETLSRSQEMAIWDHYTLLIIAAHLSGILLALRFPGGMRERFGLMWVLFALSYFLFYFRIPLLLAVVYPVAISYYNILLFRELIDLRNIQTIALSMVGVGWIATSAANAAALEHQFWIASAILVAFGIVYPFRIRRKR